VEQLSTAALQAPASQIGCSQLHLPLMQSSTPSNFHCSCWADCEVILVVCLQL